MEKNELREKILQKDCYECRVTGTLSLSFIGCFILYQSNGGFYAKKPYIQMGVRSLALASFYLGAARWFYFPPFRGLAGTNNSIEINVKK
ncbi:unnamed protein product [Auanema sp. JU1783]|nr:unnamed protein product [Auanema sp. JU1783]